MGGKCAEVNWEFNRLVKPDVREGGPADGVGASAERTGEAGSEAVPKWADLCGEPESGWTVPVCPGCPGIVSCAKEHDCVDSLPRTSRGPLDLMQHGI